MIEPKVRVPSTRNMKTSRNPNTVIFKDINGIATRIMIRAPPNVTSIIARRLLNWYSNLEKGIENICSSIPVLLSDQSTQPAIDPPMRIWSATTPGAMNVTYDMFVPP